MLELIQNRILMFVVGNPNKQFEISVSQVETMIENCYSESQPCIAYLFFWDTIPKTGAKFLRAFELGRVWSVGSEVQYRLRPNLEQEVGLRCPQLLREDFF